MDIPDSKSLHIVQDPQGQVHIILPRVGIQYLVMVSRQQAGKWVEQRHYYKMMRNRNEKIEGLQGETYKLCICTPNQCDKDQMCGVVSMETTTTTSLATTTTSNEIDVIHPEIKVPDEQSNGNSFQQNEPNKDFSLDVESSHVAGDNQSESSILDDPSIYLIIGAVISLLIIFVFASFILIFNRRKKISVETVRERGYHGDETEMVAMTGDDLGMYKTATLSTNSYERPRLVTSFNNNYDVTQQQKGHYQMVGTADKRLRHHSEQFVSMTPMATTVMRATPRHYHTLNPHSAFRGAGSFHGNYRETGNQLPRNGSYMSGNLQENYEGFRTLGRTDEVVEV